MHTLTQTCPYVGPRLDRFAFPADTAVFAVGDVHGRESALVELLDVFSGLPTPGQTRHLVFLGDLFDRGPSTLGALRAVARWRDWGFDTMTWLLGNHELMFLDAVRAARSGASPHSLLLRNWLENGGDRVLAEAGCATLPTTSEGMAQAFETLVGRMPHIEGQTVPGFLANAPGHLRVGDALFVHAGVYPKMPLAEALALAPKDHLDPDIEPKHWAWVREPFLAWPFGWAASGRAAKGTDEPGVLVVHGHTAPKKVLSIWLTRPGRLAQGLDRVATQARLNLDGSPNLVAGACLTQDGYRLAAANGHDWLD